MRLESPEFRACLAGGCVGTGALTVLMYGAPALGLPFMDMASAIGGFDSSPASLFSSGWWVGLVIFLLTGMIFSPAIYFWLRTFLMGSGWLMGLQWGVLLWGLGGVCVMFHFGFAFHEPYTSRPILTSLLSFIAHLIYGVILGSVAEYILGRAAAVSLRHREA